MARFFLNRPVFAWVVAIGMMLAGGLAIYNLPISQYPPIAPPSISITCVYPGGSAKTVEDSVVQIIEQQMTGLDKMLYIHSTSDSSGTAQIDLTFAPGTDPDLAWAKVQNKLQLAMPSLPEVVQRQGLRVAKSTRNYLMIVGLTSLDDSLDQNDLGDYTFSQIQYSLARVPGVGEVQLFGAGYAMRIWLDPNKLTNYGMTSDDVIAAVRSYNVQVSAGQLGGMPSVPGQRLNASIVVQTLLKTPEEFGAIPLRNNPDGSIVRVRDVARTELGTEFDNFRVTYNGHPASGLAIRQEAGANALATAAAVKAKIAELSRYFPPGMTAVYPFDTTPFVRVAINEVVKTLLEAIFLVFLVMFLFLGNMRATLIPTIAVPVVILGTFGVLGLFGYSINMLTMFAMVLAIGLLVDDAIVVVENVERVMSEEGLSPLEATRKSMDQITSALVGIGLVLSAVFGPMMFFGGSTGVIYQQFSVTIISSMLLSVLVALILTPVLCASLLRPMGKGHEAAETGFRLLRPFFLWFDHMFLRLRGHYQSAVGHILGKRIRYVTVFVLIVAAMGYLFAKMPTGYLPDEDQGVLLAMVQLPPGSTLEQTRAVMKKVQDHFLIDQKDAVEACLGISGFGMAGQAQNQAMAYIKLRDWDLRNRPELKVEGILRKAAPALGSIRGATIFAFPPPAVTELGTSKGFEFMLQDRGGLGHETLMNARLQVLGQAMRDPRLTSVRPNGMPDQAEHKVDIDWAKAGTLGVPVPSIQSSISTAFGSAYVNDFIQGGRVHRVYVQADAPYRMLPEDLNRLFVRNAAGRMVPVSALASGRWTYASPRLERYNGFPALDFLGEAAPGKSTGDAMAAMEEIANKLPRGIGYEWTGISYQERLSQSQTGLLYAFSVLAIFLVLAALYESWSIPISILLALPLGVIGGVLATSWRGLPNDVYFQIGLLTVLGLTTKNAILIVQFAKIRVEAGAGLIEATLEGARLRLRPIVMTSMAFGFGVLPLVIASGAGAGAQKAIGTSVLGGMITATFLAIFFIPLFFVLITQVFGRKKPGGRTVMVASDSETKMEGPQHA
jgi:HAE1 family hydrophobic/amphiphilic exporter-1